MAIDKITADDEEDGELASIAASVRSFDEAALRSLYTEKGFTDAEANALIAPMKAQNEANQRMLARAQRQETAAYTSGLREQFAYAFDADGKPLFSGSTKAEMRRNAERLHNHTASIVGATAKPAAKPAEDERAGQWGTAPAAAAEVVRETPDRTWEAARRTALNDGGSPKITVEDAKAKVKQDIKDNGPREMPRRSMGAIASRQSQLAARAAAEAKAN